MRRLPFLCLFASLVGLGAAPSACSSSDATEPDSGTSPDAGGAVNPFASSDGGESDDASIPSAADGGIHQKDGGKGSNPEASSPAPSYVPSFPQVLNAGGSVVSTPRIVPIVFAGDPMQAQIEAFTSSLATSSFWSSVGAEYGVGSFTVAPTVLIQETPAASLTADAIESWLTAKLTATNSPFGTPDANTLYAVYYPDSVSIDIGGGQLSCSTFGGYHSELALPTKGVGYAVLPRCGNMSELTVAATHEYFEWATDPLPASAPAFSRVDDDHYAWQAVMYGELGDLCTMLDYAGYQPTNFAYYEQRFWSNALSKQGAFPCAPDKTSPYFQAIPETNGTTNVPSADGLGGTVTTKAIVMKPGETKDFWVFAYSDQAGTSASIDVYSEAQITGGSSPSSFTYSLSSNTAAAGDSVRLTITAPTQPAQEVMTSVAQTSEDSTMWPIYVTNIASGSNPPLPLRHLANPIRPTHAGLSAAQRAALRAKRFSRTQRSSATPALAR